MLIGKWAFSRDLCDLTPSLIDDTRMLCELVDGPAETLCRGVPAGDQEVDDHVAEELLLLRGAALPPRGLLHEQPHETRVLPGARLLPQLPDDASGIGVQTFQVLLKFALPAHTEPPQDLPRGIGPEPPDQDLLGPVEGPKKWARWILQRPNVLREPYLANGVQSETVHQAKHVERPLRVIQDLHNLRGVDLDSLPDLRLKLPFGEHAAGRLALVLPHPSVGIEYAFTQEVSERLRKDMPLDVVLEPRAQHVLHVPGLDGRDDHLARNVVGKGRAQLLMPLDIQVQERERPEAAEHLEQRAQDRRRRQPAHLTRHGPEVSEPEEEDDQKARCKPTVSLQDACCYRQAPDNSYLTVTHR
mmetsp:Transcript_36132/g.103927  ORF Transcript_36132/g.103927 Transcript_36132/m.103927 type:complete len:358 (-) Transcript_36132:66-1139(-)